MNWKDVLKFDRAKQRQKRKDIKDALQTSRGMRLSNKDRKLFHDSMEADLIEEEREHLDGRRDKRKKMGLKGNMSLPRERRKHRGGRGRLGDTKLLPIPKGRDD